ncbi:MAG: MBOAT family O-acyltransferase [Polyangiaceae bacterium]
MLFNSIAFAKFFLLVFAGSWLLSRWPRARFGFLAAMSYVFYAGADLFDPAFWAAARANGVWSALKENAPYLKFVPIVFIGSTVDYFLAILLDRTDAPRRRKLYLVLTIAMNTGVLLVFKYWDFLAEQVIALGGPDKRMHLPTPTGISFFTFMSLSYVIDVYRREITACRRYSHYVTYIAFFPHLVAGPIIRGRDLLPLFDKRAVLTAAAAGEGMFLVAMGLIKKVVISDYLSVNFVDRVVDEPTLYSSVEVLFAMFGYAVQIYCDFSGYSDVAIGVALLLGYRLKINFDAPFKSSNLVEFWRRWHISLSSWLRDYIYIPLGGSRVTRAAESPERAARRRAASLALVVVGVSATIFSAWLSVARASHGSRNMLLFLGASAVMLVGLVLSDHGRKYLNVWITMVVCGIWHGAAWSFVLFGVIQGLAVAASHFWFDRRGKKPHDAGDNGVKPSKVLAVLVTFVFTTLTFVLIRAPLDRALLLYKQLLAGSTFTPNITKPIVLMIAAGFFLQWSPKSLYEGAKRLFTAAPAPAQAAILFVLAVVLREVATTDRVPFVYGQF